jgi:hypothetical protein
MTTTSFEIGRHLLVLSLTASLGCGFLYDCDPGEQALCECALEADYEVTCDVTGFWPNCDCSGGKLVTPPNGPVGGHDSDYVSGESEPSETDESAGKRAYDDLLDYYPECASTYRNDCHGDEVKIPCTNLCWRICPVDQYWDGADCQYRGGSYLGTPETALAVCQALDSSYRNPTLDEFTALLNYCPAVLDQRVTNRCAPYVESAMRFVLKINERDLLADYWVSDPQWCPDAYGTTTKSCAWKARLYGGTLIPTPLDFLYAHGSYGSALAVGLCVREQPEYP